VRTNIKSEYNLIWIDLEMTGLAIRLDTIIEIATVVTDAQLNVLAEGPVMAIHVEQTKLDAMDEWCTTHHGRSGLTKRVQESKITLREAEVRTLKFLKKWAIKGKSPMSGNSICQDRRFLIEEMPELELFFHYRNLDVSSLKELAKRWAPEVYASHKKKSAHLALDDIYESIGELQHYRQYLLAKEAQSDDGKTF